MQRNLCRLTQKRFFFIKCFQLEILFEILNNSNGKEQLDLIGLSIRRIVEGSCNALQAKQEIHINMIEIDEHINQLLHHLNRLHYRETTMTEQWFDVD